MNRPDVRGSFEPNEPRTPEHQEPSSGFEPLTPSLRGESGTRMNTQSARIHRARQHAPACPSRPTSVPACSRLVRTPHHPRSQPMHRPSPAQRRALHLASRKGGTLVCSKLVDRDDGTRGVPRDQVSVQISNVLIGHAWVTIHNKTILITVAGRSALAAPIPDTPVYLKERDGLTTERSRAIKGEDEVMDTATLSDYWNEHALRLKAAAADRRAEAKRRANQIRRAA